MNRDQTRLAELRVTNRENPLVKVDISEVQSQRLTDPKPRDTQQSVKSVTNPPRNAGRADSVLQGLRQQPLHLLVGIQIEAVAPWRAWDQICWWHFSAGVDTAVIGRKAAHGAKSQPLIGEIGRWALPHPPDHRLCGDAPGPVVLHEPYETCLLYTSDAADDLLCVDLG